MLNQRLESFSLLGAVLVDLVKRYPDLNITALVRNPSHVEAVRNLGVNVVQGTFSDTELISSRARAAEITVNTAESDDTALNEAILTGQKARVVQDGKPPPVLLHTSGVAVFSDSGKEGKHDPNGKLWNVGLSSTPPLLRATSSPVLGVYRIKMKRTFVPSLPRCYMVKSTHRASSFNCTMCATNQDC